MPQDCKGSSEAWIAADDDEVETLAQLEECSVLFMRVVNPCRQSPMKHGLLGRGLQMSSGHFTSAQSQLAAHARSDHAVGERNGVIAMACKEQSEYTQG